MSSSNQQLSPVLLQHLCDLRNPQAVSSSISPVVICTSIAVSSSTASPVSFIPTALCASYPTTLSSPNSRCACRHPRAAAEAAAPGAPTILCSRQATSAPVGPGNSPPSHPWPSPQSGQGCCTGTGCHAKQPVILRLILQLLHDFLMLCVSS